jgi:ankyrin repeat protein
LLIFLSNSSILLLVHKIYFCKLNKKWDAPVGTPLHQAIVRQDLRLVEHFVQLGANLEIYHGRSTPLATAVLTNNKSIVELLITSGSNLNPTGFDVNYPLLSAVINNFLDIAAILLENGASVNRIDTLSGDTLLHESILKNNILMTDLLIHYGANVNVTNYGGSTPLGLSHTRIGHEKIKSLLLQYGATNYGLDD